MSRTLAAALALALTAAVLPASTCAAEEPSPRAAGVGAPGIGDPYWPLDGNGGIDVQHYDIVDAYDFDRGRLSGTTTLTVRARADLSRFNLDLLLPVRTVTVDGVPAAFGKPRPHELRITPAVAMTRGESFEVVVTYAGTPGPISYAGERNWLADDTEVVAMNEPHMAPWWYAANDHPRDKATFDITVTGPATHQVVANGLLVDRSVSGVGAAAEATTHWRSAAPMTTYNAFFALGRYRVERSVRAGLPSYIAVSRGLAPSDVETALRQLRRSDEITAWLAGQLGPYPFESTGGLVTALDVGFALENQTRPTYPSAPGRSLMAHELAHQWFGDSVSVHGWRDIWLNEGFATFMEVRYAETHGGLRAQQWLHRTRDSFDAWRLDIADPGPRNVFDGAVYTRGAMALQALRHRMGDDRFFRVLRTWVREHRYGTGTVGGFRALAERVSRQQLDGFFRAWLRAPRAPARTKANGLR